MRVTEKFASNVRPDAVVNRYVSKLPEAAGKFPPTTAVRRIVFAVFQTERRSVALSSSLLWGKSPETRRVNLCTRTKRRRPHGDRLPLSSAGGWRRGARARNDQQCMRGPMGTVYLSILPVKVGRFTCWLVQCPSIPNRLVGPAGEDTSLRRPTKTREASSQSVWNDCRTLVAHA